MSTFVPPGLFRADEPTVDLHVFAGRSFDIEAAFESFSSPRAIELRDAPGCRDGLGHVVDEETRDPIVDDFRRLAAPESDHRSAAGHRLDHDESEWLRPINWK